MEDERGVAEPHEIAGQGNSRLAARPDDDDQAISCSKQTSSLYNQPQLRNLFSPQIQYHACYQRE